MKKCKVCKGTGGLKRKCNCHKKELHFHNVMCSACRGRGYI